MTRPPLCTWTAQAVLCRQVPGLDEELLGKLGTRVKSIHPSAIEVFFRDPDYALCRMPTRVLANFDDDPSQKTVCFFKSFGRSEDLLMEHELETHLKGPRSEVHRSNTRPHAC